MKDADAIIRALNRIDIEIEKLKLRMYAKKCTTKECMELECEYVNLVERKVTLEWVLEEETVTEE